MEPLAWALAVTALIWCCTLSSRLKKIETLLKEPETRREEASLRQILQQHIGSSVRLELSDWDSDFADKPCIILDADEQWVLVRLEKKDLEGLIRIRQIKGLAFMAEM